MQPAPDSGSQSGSYILSYPGIAFTFPLQSSAWSHGQDFVSLLSSSSAAAAKSMAIYDGASWREARQALYTKECLDPRSFNINGKGKDLRPDEVDHILVSLNGKLDIIRRNSHPFKISLGVTTPQDLVAELGPPDAIYRKSDRRLSIHRTRPRHASGTSSAGYDSNDTDHSHAVTDESDAPDEENPAEALKEDASAECFYNFFYHGFDVFISPDSSRPKRPFPSSANALGPAEVAEPDQLVAMKILIHGNIPGSYPFNRYRRCRWIIDSPAAASAEYTELNSETPFAELSETLQQIWQSNLDPGDSHGNFQQGMVLNRGWGNSPGSSCELLGGWEENDAPWKNNEKTTSDDSPGLGNTELFGFPGLVFEVLKNNAVSCLTVY